MAELADDPQYREWRDLVEPLVKRFDLCGMFDGLSACWDKEGSIAMANVMRRVALAADRGVQFHQDTTGK